MFLGGKRGPIQDLGLCHFWDHFLATTYTFVFSIDFQGCVFWIASSMFAFQHLALTYDSAGLPQLGVLKLIAWKFFTNYLTSLLFLIFLQNNNEPCQTLSTHKLIHILLSQTQSSLQKNLNSWLCSHQDHDTSDYKLGFLTNLIIFLLHQRLHRVD